MNQEKIGKFIAKCRKDMKMTQQELAEKLNVTDKAISKWENGRCLMDISLLKPLSEILNVTILELINGENINATELNLKTDEVIKNTLTFADKKIKKNKIKNTVCVISILILIIMISFFSYKGILVNKYKAPISNNYKEIINGLTMDENLKIYKKTINEESYLMEDDLKIRNDFTNFERIEKQNDYDSTKYLLHNENNELISGVMIGKTDSYINMFSADSIMIFNDKDQGQFNNADRTYFLLRNDINNDLDFLEYIKNNYYAKNNLFLNTRNIKENYAFNTFVSIAIPIVESTTVISGDYTGYIFNLKNNTRTVNIFRNDKVYVLTFVGEKYNDDNYLKDLLSTLEIK